jgi:putative zinc finger protein
MKCPSQGVLRAYLDQELPVQEPNEIEAHLEECAGCRELAHELSTLAGRVHAQLLSLDVPQTAAEENPQLALASFKAQLDFREERISFIARIFDKRWRPAWVTAMAVTVLLASLAFPAARGWAQRLLATLRVEKVQTVSLDLSSFDGNRSLQQRLGKMISDKVVVTTDEKRQSAASAEAASQLAGFEVQLISARSDSPQFNVEGAHAFQTTIDRNRLQDILDQSGRSDLILPANLDGATVAVQIPRSVELKYGNCSGNEGNESGDLDGVATPHQVSSKEDCVFLVEAPSPVVNVPSDLNLQQLAETALELGGMTPGQARQFCQTVDWKSTLVLPIPRFVQSYDRVEVNGVQGTLIQVPGNRGRGGKPSYVLIWVKNGMIYCLGGSGDSSQAVELASTLN